MSVLANEKSFGMERLDEHALGKLISLKKMGNGDVSCPTPDSNRFLASNDVTESLHHAPKGLEMFHLRLVFRIPVDPVDIILNKRRVVRGNGARLTLHINCVAGITLNDGQTEKERKGLLVGRKGRASHLMESGWPPNGNGHRVDPNRLAPNDHHKRPQIARIGRSVRYTHAQFRARDLDYTAYDPSPSKAVTSHSNSGMVKTPHRTYYVDDTLFALLNHLMEMVTSGVKADE
ncbi:hypothetical protein C8R43DRAFT_954833 [Mycena crocata]|nr:hypothetical protein C8R43DRAFT_954833 [Mycena crocata]